MKMVKTKLALSAAIAALALSAGSANAAITWTTFPYDTGPGSNTLIADFDTPIAAGYDFTGDASTGIGNGNLSPVAANPALDATDYFYVMADGFASLTTTTASPLKSLSMYIGSLDSYNFITFWSGATSYRYSGTDLALPANGDQGDGATNRTFYFDFGGVNVDRVDFESVGKNSFEFDNIAVSAAPEPGVWALMISGFGMLGAALRRRRTAVGAIA